MSASRRFRSQPPAFAGPQAAEVQVGSDSVPGSSLFDPCDVPFLPLWPDPSGPAAYASKRRAEGIPHDGKSGGDRLRRRRQKLLQGHGGEGRRTEVIPASRRVTPPLCPARGHRAPLNEDKRTMSTERTNIRVGFVGAGLFLAPVIIAAVLLVLSAKPARSHDALPTASQPLGWTYDYSCCSLADCREVKDSAVKEDSRGFTIVATGELLPYGDKRLKKSKDEFFHLCTVAGLEDSRPLCLYVPDRGI